MSMEYTPEEEHNAREYFAEYGDFRDENDKIEVRFCSQCGGKVIYPKMPPVAGYVDAHPLRPPRCQKCGYIEPGDAAVASCAMGGFRHMRDWHNYLHEQELIRQGNEIHPTCPSKGRVRNDG